VSGRAVLDPSGHGESRAARSLVRIEPTESGVAIIGELDLSNVPSVEAALSDIVIRRKLLTLDLTGLSYLDSRGVAMLSRVAVLARRQGGVLTLANPQDIVRLVIDLAQLEDAVSIVDDV
jgi:anti-sigma B factor antagonist